MYSLKPSRLKKIKRNIAFAPEEKCYMGNATVYENLYEIIRMRKDFSQDPFDKIVPVLNLTGLISKREVPLNALSSNEKKLFKLAFALIRDAEIFLLDFNLYMNSFSAGLIDILKSLSSEGRCVVVSASDKADLNLPGRMYANIKDGEII